MIQLFRYESVIACNCTNKNMSLHVIKAASCRPANLLKLNSFTGVFQGF